MKKTPIKATLTLNLEGKNPLKSKYTRKFYYYAYKKDIKKWIKKEIKLIKKQSRIITLEIEIEIHYI